MNIAITYENGNIFQHFGHTEMFKFYEICDGNVIKSEIISTEGAGHGALSGFLKEHNIDAVICGGIGGGARQALSSAGIEIFGGVSGNADKAAEAFAKGNLEYDTNASCTGHDHSKEGGCHDNGKDGCHNGGCHSKGSDSGCGGGCHI